MQCWLRILIQGIMLLSLATVIPQTVSADEEVVYSQSDCNRNGTNKKYSTLNYNEDWTEQIGWFSCPVFYVTDRLTEKEKNCNCYSEHQLLRKLGGKLEYGIKNVAAPLTPHLDDASEFDEFFSLMKWQKINKDRHRKPDLDLPQTPSLTVTKSRFDDFSKFTDALNAYRKDAKLLEEHLPNKHLSNEVIVFVHGCCQPFQYHLEHAGYLQSWIKAPVISYDWTAPRVNMTTVDEYIANEVNVQRAQDRFNSFLKSLEEKLPHCEISLVAHSMGNRLIEEALLRREPSARKFKEVVFGCADTDSEAFLNHLDAVASQAQMVRIYTSHRDMLLALSTLVHGKYQRLGNMHPDGAKDFLRPNVEVYDVTDLGLNHDLPLWAISNIHKTGLPKNDRGFACDVDANGVHVFTKANASKRSSEVTVWLLDESERDPSFIETLEKKIEKHWHPERHKLAGKNQFIAAFDLDQKGKISKLEVENSSGQPGIDDAAKKAIRLGTMHARTNKSDAVRIRVRLEST
jgi:hypothetical protein